MVLTLFSVFFWSLPFYQERSETLQNLSLKTRDIFFKIRRLSSETPSNLSDILIVSIDEESCEKLKSRWPWSRKVFASMIDALGKRGAKAIGFNISFTGSEGEEDASSRIFAQSAAAFGRVVVGATFDKEDHLIRPNPTIGQSVSGYGYLEKIIDPDFTIRRSYLIRLYSKRKNTDGVIFESSFPLELLAVAGALSLKTSETKPSFDPDLEQITAGSPHRSVKVDENGAYFINYLATESDFEEVPVWKVIEGKISDSQVRGKVVLVGLTSSLFADTHQTPLGMMPGVVIHANEFLSIASGRNLSFAPERVSLLISWLAAACILIFFLTGKFWLGLLSTLIAVAGLFVGAEAAFSKDFVLEPFVLMLGPLLAAGTGVLTHQLKLFWENRGLEMKVIHDKMTGLFTYDFLRIRLDDEWKKCKKTGLPVSLVMADLDRFKKINDTLGHEVGNQMILRAAAVIRESVRGYDVVARYGGDEFIILLWHANRKDAEDYRQRLRDLYHHMASKLDELLSGSSVSIGVATFDPHANAKFPESPQRLIEEADRDLFEDKDKRRKLGN